MAVEEDATAPAASEEPPAASEDLPSEPPMASRDAPEATVVAKANSAWEPVTVASSVIDALEDAVVSAFESVVALSFPESVPEGWGPLGAALSDLISGGRIDRALAGISEAVTGIGPLSDASTGGFPSSPPYPLTRSLPPAGASLSSAGGASMSGIAPLLLLLCVLIGAGFLQRHDGKLSWLLFWSSKPGSFTRPVLERPG